MDAVSLLFGVSSILAGIFLFNKKTKLYSVTLNSTINGEFTSTAINEDTAKKFMSSGNYSLTDKENAQEIVYGKPTKGFYEIHTHKDGLSCIIYFYIYV